MRKAAINFKERTIEVKNLFPRTSYQFRITSGDENGYNTEGGAVISVETYITRTLIVRVYLV
mgnify:CR=1 FL=1